MSEIAAPKPGGALETALRRLENLAAIVAGFAMIVSMFLTSMDAILRYAIGSPFAFTTYLNEHYLLATLLCLPLAWGFRQGGYLRFIAIFGFMPRLFDDTLVRVGLLLGAGYTGTMTWLSAGRFWEAYTHGDIQMGVIDWPVSWQWLPVPIGLGLLTLRLLVIAFGKPDGLYSGEESTGDEL